MTRELPTTGVERFFGKDEIIVSKTDLKGRITYANQVFVNLAGYTEQELLGQPHSIIRHPDMPRAVFKLVWDTIEAGKEIFGYVINRAKNGDHYWVYAHVTPSFGPSGEIIGYHSNRRVPNPDTVKNVIAPLYAQLREVERSHANAKEGMKASVAAVLALLQENGVSYDEFVMSLDQDPKYAPGARAADDMRAVA
ncbi:MAG: PAS domain-containing protein [Tepidamorphaceae bacterium]|nr:PAS domain-containing protein [Rhodobiaceae bacterium]MCC0047585.1 PAS domain-containing protein [Rhodobiaceae bacterium]